MLFLNNFILCCINAPLHKCACELEASSSSTLPRGRQEEEGKYRTPSLREALSSLSQKNRNIRLLVRVWGFFVYISLFRKEAVVL